jgi:hypothetical protein
MKKGSLGNVRSATIGEIEKRCRPGHRNDRSETTAIHLGNHPAKVRFLADGRGPPQSSLIAPPYDQPCFPQA